MPLTVKSFETSTLAAIGCSRRLPQASLREIERISTRMCHLPSCRKKDGAALSMFIECRRGSVERSGPVYYFGALIDGDIFMRPLTIQWSSRAGMSFAGGGGFTVTQNTALHPGQVTMQALRPAIPSSSDAGHPPDSIVKAGASFDASIGPVWASGNNAGPFDFGVGFMPLNGVGVSHRRRRLDRPRAPR
jgi:hypothetical protein